MDGWLLLSGRIPRRTLKNQRSVFCLLGLGVQVENSNPKRAPKRTPEGNPFDRPIKSCPKPSAPRFGRCVSVTEIGKWPLVHGHALSAFNSRADKKTVGSPKDCAAKVGSPKNRPRLSFPLAVLDRLRCSQGGGPCAHGKNQGLKTASPPPNIYIYIKTGLTSKSKTQAAKQRVT